MSHNKRERHSLKVKAKKYIKRSPLDTRMETERKIKHVKQYFNPRKLQTVDEAWKRFEAFLRYCKEERVPMTVERLAIFLGLNRTALLRYTENAPKEIAQAIGKMRDFVTADKVERLNSVQNVTGIIFDLKNNENFSDKQTIEHSGEISFNQRIRSALMKSKEV